MFCVKCGAQATEGAVKFCTSCGSPLLASANPAGPAAQSSSSVAAPSAQPAAPATAPSAPPAGAQPSSPWIKVLIVVVAFVVFAGAAVIGTGAYIGYRMKKKVQEAKAEYGLDKIGSLSPNPGASPVQERDVCSLLSKEEVSEITGVTITDAQGSTSQCTYSSATNPTVVQDMVTWQGGAMAFKLQVGTMKITGGGEQALVKLPGIGDEAVTIGLQGKAKEEFKGEGGNDPASLMLKGITNMLGTFPLMFRKGDVAASVGVSEAPDLDEAKKALAKKIASRL